MKRYEILESLPVYGPMYIPITEDGQLFYSEGFPVRFYNSDGTDWVANFKPGWTKLKRVIEFEMIQELLIIACGTCYLMDPNHSKAISVFGGSFSDIFEASNNRLVLQDELKLTIIEPNGTHWDTERISWDDLKDLRVENNVVTGLSYDPIDDAGEWVLFAYDLDTQTLTGGSYNKYAFSKPWWKIW
ncbi:hypothetical protein V6Z05_14985 [Leptospira venezuelensis]|uniref:hypothetical protein n=1 Tax=Leptospira venezuelensis TaxID=1958811 RepID=UPI0012FF7A56|nr:hypothetical protein [Leptospira venezuelensis]